MRYSVAPQGRFWQVVRLNLKFIQLRHRAEIDHCTDLVHKVNIANRFHNINSLIPFVIPLKSNIFVF